MRSDIKYFFLRMGVGLLYLFSCLGFSQSTARGPARPAVQPSNPQPSGPDVLEQQLAAVQSAASGGDLTALRDFLRNPAVDVQTAAFDALAARDTAGAVRDLTDVVNDTSAAGRLQALQMLNGSSLADDQTLVNNLRSAAGANDSAMAEYASQALAHREHPDDPPVLNSSPGEQFSAESTEKSDTPAGTDPGPNGAAPGDDKQTEAASSAKDEGTTAHTDAASESSGDENKVSVDDLAARFRDRSLPAAERLQALQKVDESNGDEWRVTALLREALSDSEATLRAYAVQGIMKRANAGSTPAVDAARDAVHSSDRTLRLLAVQSLGHSEAAQPLLREAASDSDKEVRAAAESLLNNGAGDSAATPKQ